MSSSFRTFSSTSSLGDLFVLVPDRVDGRGETSDLRLEFVQAVFEFVRVGPAVVHLPELVAATEVAELVLTAVVDAPESAQFLVVAVFRHQSTAVGHPLLVVATGVVVTEDTDHLPNAHSDQAAREQHQKCWHDAGRVGHSRPKRLGGNETTHYPVTSVWYPSNYRFRYHM